jgi:SAM-dependent methyltransferase
MSDLNARGRVRAKGWFHIPGIQNGDRTFDDQMTGLREHVQVAAGSYSTALDLGCAEGLVAAHLARERGFKYVQGIEVIPRAVNVARAVCAGLPVTITQADGNHLRQMVMSEHSDILQSYDLVLALSILHKFADPNEALRCCAMLAWKRLIVRTPKPVISDRRSNFIEIDVQRVCQEMGLRLWAEPPGPKGEWQGVFDRC